MNSVFFFLLYLATTFACFSADKCTKVKCETTESGVTLRVFSGHVVADTKIVGREFSTTLTAKEPTCVQECIQLENCTTIVVSGSETKCWLYQNYDIYENLTLLKKENGFKIISLGHGACRKQPCNFGKCIPDYDNLTYACQCFDGYVGEKCDKVVSQPEMTPVVHFSFDTGTVDDDAVFKHLKITLKDGKLIKTPERRGKVAYVGNDQDAFHVTFDTDAHDSSYNGWFRNFFYYQGDFTLSFWLKRNWKKLEDKDRDLFYSYLWRITFNDMTSTIKFFIGVHGDPTGSGFYLECSVPDARQWNYFAFAGSGVIKDSPAIIYRNGQLCKFETLTNKEKKLNYQHDGSARHDFRILRDHVGFTFLDELKVFQAYPKSDAVIKAMYEKEKEELTN